MKTTLFSSTRRAILGTLAIAVSACFPIAGQAAEKFPQRAVTLVVPFSPGGGTDISARILAERLTSVLGQTVVVENKAGAGGQIAADLVARADPDGYTLLFANSGMLSINPWIYNLKTVSLFSDLPFVLVVPPTLEAKNVEELVALAKAEPGKRTYASSGTGGAPHLTGEVFQIATGTELLHVPYKGGGPAMADLMGGRVDMLFASVLETNSFVQGGKLRALAVTGAKRSPAMPDVPTIEEAGVKNAQGGSWTGVLAPKGTPQAIIDKLSLAIRDVADDEDIVQRLLAQGAGAYGSTPEALAKLAASERARYGEIIKARGLQAQ
jgi:tripartite-type tricarboxylate transporter receptor subunit TctC